MNLERAGAIAEAWRGRRVAVVGDLILDRYVWGRATRISPEAPVPVVNVARTTAVPGGSANVLRNLARLGAETAAFGVVGCDAASEELRGLLDGLAVDCAGVVADGSRPTTEKTRVVAGSQQVVRIDTEELAPIGAGLAGEMAGRLEEEARAGRIDAVILEDYGKGVLSSELLDRLSGLAAKHGLIVALDPHPANAFRAKGLSLISPNRSEAFSLAGMYEADGRLPVEDDRALLGVVSKLYEEWAPDRLLVTLGGDGMALFDEGLDCLHIPTRAKEVFDVSGAGDTVIASYVLALLGGASAEEAAVVSNHAAGIVVGVVGTAPVSRAELLASFAAEAS